MDQRPDDADNGGMRTHTTLAERLQHILETCKFPTQRAFMTALGEAPTQWRNWSRRESVGRGDVKIHRLTGVDIGWLKTGEGTPFPNGPTIYDGAEPPDLKTRMDSAENLLEQFGTVLHHLLAAVSQGAPAAGDLVVRALEQDLKHALGPNTRATELALEIAKAARKRAAGANRPGPPRSTS